MTNTGKSLLDTCSVSEMKEKYKITVRYSCKPSWEVIKLELQRGERNWGAVKWKITLNLVRLIKTAEAKQMQAAVLSG